MRGLHIVALVMLVLGAPAVTAAAGPKMMVEESVKDFGEVSQGTVLDLAFEVTNEGDETLEIEVRPTCGCTVVDYDKSIEPGARGVVKAKVDTADFSGPITKTMLVVGNDPQQPTLRLAVQALVRPVLEVLPRPLVRLRTSAGSPASATVVLTSIGGDNKKFEITGIDTGSEFVTTAVRELGEDERVAGRGPSQYEITVSLADNAPLGMHSEPLVVHTNHPNASKIQIKMLGMVTTS